MTVDGRPLSDKEEGSFVGATLIDHVTPGMSVYEMRYLDLYYVLLGWFIRGGYGHNRWSQTW